MGLAKVPQPLSHNSDSIGKASWAWKVFNCVMESLNMKLSWKSCFFPLRLARQTFFSSIMEVNWQSCCWILNFNSLFPRFCFMFVRCCSPPPLAVRLRCLHFLSSKLAPSGIFFPLLQIFLWTFSSLKALFGAAANPFVFFSFQLGRNLHH